MTMADRRPLRGPGINTFQIDAARKVHARTVQARIPQGAASAAAERFISPSPPTTSAVRRLVPRHVCNSPNNPPCASCGTMIVPSPAATLPLQDCPSMTINNWTISTRKKPILNSQELEDWENNKLKGLTLPEMIFGNSYVRIENTLHGWTLEFNALDALKQVKLADCGIRVSYSKKWMDSKQQKQAQRSSSPTEFEVDDSSLKIAHHYDWTYTTRYRGTEESKDQHYKFIRDDTQQLPLDKLSRPDHILFYDDMILFEDELADNGISILNVKIRVMDERLLLLNRFFLRVDDVLLRVIDTRVCVEFDENKVMREYKEMEGDYKSLLANHRISHSHDPKAALRDSNWVAQHAPVVSREYETLNFD